MQAAVKSNIAELIKAYTGDNSGNAILLGCQFSYASNATTWTAGIVCIAGEVLAIDAGTVGGAVGPDYFDIVSVLSGSRQFGDGNSHDCFEERKATVTRSATAYPVSSFRRVSPADVLDPKEFQFDTLVQRYDEYALLVYCGGAWHLSLRQPAMSAASQEIFSGSVSGVPDALIQRFQRQQSPVSMRCMVLTFTEDVAICTISWTVSSGKINFAVRADSAVQLGSYEVHATLPIF